MTLKSTAVLLFCGLVLLNVLLYLTELLSSGQAIRAMQVVIPVGMGVAAVVVAWPFLASLLLGVTSDGNVRSGENDRAIGHSASSESRRISLTWRPLVFFQSAIGVLVLCLASVFYRNTNEWTAVIVLAIAYLSLLVFSIVRFKHIRDKYGGGSDAGVSSDELSSEFLGGLFGFAWLALTALVSAAVAIVLSISA